MKLGVNVEKRYAIGMIMSFLILAGAIFGVAQWNQPDVWHDASAVKVNVNGEKDLQTAINNDFCRGDGVNCPTGSINYMATWTPVSKSNQFYQDGDLDYANLNIPPDANEILIYVRGWQQGKAGGTIGIKEIDIYTKEGTKEYLTKFGMLEGVNNFDYGSSSEDMWLPITSDNKVYVRGMDWTGQQDWIQIDILGYR